MNSNIVQVGDLCPDFKLQSNAGRFINNNKILGKTTLFFIYPKNDTSSCTKEAQGFSDLINEFISNDVEVFGVSKDSIQSHIKFIAKYSLKVELLSDEKLEFISSIGAWVEKTMYGKHYMGVERTSVLISNNGQILKIWRKVRVPGHVQQVFDTIKENS